MFYFTFPDANTNIGAAYGIPVASPNQTQGQFLELLYTDIFYYQS